VYEVEVGDYVNLRIFVSTQVMSLPARLDVLFEFNFLKSPIKEFLAINL